MPVCNQLYALFRTQYVKSKSSRHLPCQFLALKPFSGLREKHCILLEWSLLKKSYKN